MRLDVSQENISECDLVYKRAKAATHAATMPPMLTAALEALEKGICGAWVAAGMGAIVELDFPDTVDVMIPLGAA